MLPNFTTKNDNNIWSSNKQKMNILKMQHKLCCLISKQIDDKICKSSNKQIFFLILSELKQNILNHQ